MLPECSFAQQLDDSSIGENIYSLAAGIYPICRSITGNGVRETLKHLACHIEIDVHEVPPGTQVFDWTIPREWNIRDAYIKDQRGQKIIDFARSNLHDMCSSVLVRKRMPLAELKGHIHTLPQQPELIPYRTLNYCDFLGFKVDRNPYKHGQFTPGMHVPICDVGAIDEAKPDFILILPWNLQHEIVQQMRHVAEWGATFIVPVPEVTVIDPRGRQS